MEKNQSFEDEQYGNHFHSDGFNISMINDVALFIHVDNDSTRE